MQEAQQPINDNDALRELTGAIRGFIQRNPEAHRVLTALAAWLQAVAAPLADAPPRPTDSDQRVEQPHEITPIEPPPIAAIQPIAVAAAPPDHAAASQAQLSALGEKWKNPGVSEKIKPASATATARDKPIAPNTALENTLRRLDRRLKHHLKAIEWAIDCGRRGFWETKVEYDRLCALGQHDQVFFWELQRDGRSCPVSFWNELWNRYAAVVAAIELYLDKPRENFRKNGILEVVAHAASTARAGLTTLRQTPFSDNDVESLVQLCTSHLPQDRPLPPSTSSGEPFNLAAFLERIAAIRTGIRDQIKQEAAPQQALKKLDYHLRQLKENPHEAESHAPSICTAIQGFVEAGRPISDRALAATFGSLDNIEVLPRGVREDPLCAQVIALLTDPSAAAGVDCDDGGDDDGDGDDTESTQGRALTPEVRAVRAALRGKRVVMIGGDERPNSRRAIREAFELSELVWVATRSHQPHDRLIRPIQNPDTAVVLLLIRFASHSYGEMSKVCEDCGKPFVRVPGGYSTNSIAQAIIEQAGQRLGIPLAAGAA